jgi:hypothetical protein
LYSAPTIQRCPKCSTILLFPLDLLLNSLKGEFPNWISQLGFKVAFRHDGLIYNGTLGPRQVQKGNPALLKLYVQSFYIGPIALQVGAWYPGAIKNKPISQVSTALSALEVAEVTIPIETTFDTKSGNKRVHYKLSCAVPKNTKKITDLKELEQVPNLANLVTSAKHVLGGRFWSGSGLRDDGQTYYLFSSYKVLDEKAQEQRIGLLPIYKTLWPVATSSPS